MTYDEASDGEEDDRADRLARLEHAPERHAGRVRLDELSRLLVQTPARVSVFTRTPSAAQYVARYRVRLRIADFETE